MMRWSIGWVCYVLLHFWKHRVPARRPSPRQKARALWTRCSRCIRRSARSVSGPSSVGHHFLEETNYGNAMEKDFKFSYPHLRINIWMFPKIVGFSPKSSVLNRGFPLICHHPFWGNYIPLFLDTPISPTIPKALLSRWVSDDVVLPWQRLNLETQTPISRPTLYNGLYLVFGCLPGKLRIHRWEIWIVYFLKEKSIRNPWILDFRLVLFSGVQCFWSLVILFVSVPYLEKILPSLTRAFHLFPTNIGTLQ